MKAIRVHQYAIENPMILENLPEPVPQTGQVRIRLEHAGINPNETYVMTGTYAFFTPPLPFTPGFDGAGTIDAVGPGVTAFSPGDRVWLAGFLDPANTGTYAEQAVASQEYVHPLPDSVSFAQGAALGIPALAAYRAIYLRGEVRPGQTVLIHGASGGVGLLAIQMAKALGAKVIGTASSEEGRELIRTQGADYAMDHLTRENLPELAEWTGQRGPDVIIEFLANRNLALDMEIIDPYGKIVVVGSRGPIEINPRLLMGKDSDIRGLGIPNYTALQQQEALAAISRLLTEGRLRPVIGRHFTLEEANEAHQVILNQKTLGKLVFDLNQSDPQHK
ncbi:NADPH:quinone reductase [Clostridiaceae bacterium HFYG-1003]|nr:NADPH:quinone reductase [Clostridiaceae bacterium HFYG-1003]